MRKSVMSAAIPGLSATSRERLFAVARLEHVVAVAMEDGPEHLAQVQLVVGEDDAGSRHASNAITRQVLARSGDVIGVA